MTSKLILIGGFLGAGKTTLLRKMAELLSEENKKVGLITNDQASELVDTELLSKSRGIISEVSGSCFCCNYKGFTDAVTELHNSGGADYIIAEPVGSCTDLSATIIQPLKDQCEEKIEICPLNVLVDPIRLKSILDGKNSGLHKSAAYIVQKQLEEADYIVINKLDLLTEDELHSLLERAADKWPQAKIFAVSARNGDHISEWMSEVLSSRVSGTHLAQVDYDIYAEGEAVLGWLNTCIALSGRGVDWNKFAKILLRRLKHHFDRKGAAIGHVKLIIKDKDTYVVGNLTGTSQEISLQGTANISRTAEMTLNARVELPPEELKRVVLKELRSICRKRIRYEIKVLNSLQPGRPNPTHRYQEVI